MLVVNVCIIEYNVIYLQPTKRLYNQTPLRAKYYNKTKTYNMEYRYLGEDVKIGFHIKPIDGMTLDDFDWSIQLWCNSNNIKTLHKSDTISKGDGKYAVCINTEDYGVGVLQFKMDANVVDVDFKNKLRKQIGIRKLFCIESID